MCKKNKSDIRERRLQRQQEVALAQLIKRNSEVERLPKILKEQLKSIEPESISFSESEINIYPCAALLKNGNEINTLYLIPAFAANRCWWIKKENNIIKTTEIEKIIPSKYRLPAKFSNKIQCSGESGMGYTSGTFAMSDGKELNWVASETFEFPELPIEYNISDIIQVNMHKSNGKNKEPIRSREYNVVLYNL